jgi:hypothetical protein
MKVTWRGEPMQFFAKVSKRVPVREVAPTLLAVLALAGILGHGAPIFRGILDLVGNYWG